MASYEQVGLYLTKVTVTDTAGNNYKDTAIVNVVDVTQMDNIFKPIWNGMKAALNNNDITAAMNYFTTDSKQSYQQQFTALSPSVPQIAASMGDINAVRSSTNYTEYEFRVTQNGVIYSFQLLFGRDTDGTWKIMSY
jgi:hypothetical protein